MMQQIISTISAVLLLAGFGCSKSPSHKKQSEGRSIEFTNKVVFLNKKGEPVTTIDAAVADDESERNEGLMDVNDLPSQKGMLFLFEKEQSLSFWMANTPLPLDIIFVTSEKKIIRIHRSVPPFSEKNFNSGAPAQYVVETNGGFCVGHDIQEGMSIKWDRNE